jgi:hypothetical protein
MFDWHNNPPRLKDINLLRAAKQNLSPEPHRLRRAVRYLISTWTEGRYRQTSFASPATTDLM